ncbi:MAG: hypothetical protein ACLQVD_10045 [Capsulimonadaceae bacterium]
MHNTTTGPEFDCPSDAGCDRVGLKADDGGRDQEDGRRAVDGVAADGHLEDVDLVLDGGEEDGLAGVE